MNTARTGVVAKIRPMEPEDISAVLDIDRKISKEYRAVTYNSLITGDLGGELDLSFVAEVNGEVIGFILARHSHFGEPVVEAGMIQILWVDPDYRRRGIATGLVNALIEQCKNRRLKTVSAMVEETDSQLQGLLARMRFQRGHLIDYTRAL